MSFERKMRLAAGQPPPFPPKGGPPIMPTKRKIPKDHPFDPKSLKPMAKMLWALSISLGHALTAYRQFNRLKSVSVSPDGMLGGHGYIMPIPEMRKKLFEVCEAISAISDTVHDEINAPHWQPRLADLDPNAAEDVERFVEEAKDTLENPEEDATEDMQEIERENDDKWRAKGVEPKPDEPSSEVPSGGDISVENHTFDDHNGMPPRFASYDRRQTASSSLPVNTIPGGPRVDHIGPGEGRGPWGTYNDDASDDAWIEDQDEHEPLGWGQVAQSGLPEDPTPTDADDFGIGYGRKGDGSKGYGVKSPDGGVHGPASELPQDPGGKLHDTGPGGTTPSIETHLPPRGDIYWASTMPNDGEPPVARTDYYPDDRTDYLPEDVALAQSGLPGDQSVTYDYGRNTMRVNDTSERFDNPYVRWDSTTRTYKPDPTYERNPHEDY